MARYIDVDLAIDEIIKDMCGVPDIDEGLSTALSELRLMPTADVAPVVHGEWLHTEMIDDEEDSGVNSDATRCSICGEYQSSYYWATTYYNYCPNCGADMRGGINDIH